jgi:WS/DGAT/MGAT family acyltransferase
MRIAPMDLNWLVLERAESPAHVACLAECTPPDDAPGTFVADLVAGWRAHRTFAKPFNRRPRLLPVPVWDVLHDDEVDLDYHFRHSALPAPGGGRELGILVSRLHSHALDRRRPLWELHIIEGLGDGRFAMYLKVHHSLMDGVAGIRMLGRALSADRDARDHPPIWALGSSIARPQAPPAPMAEARVLRSGVGRVLATPVRSVRGLHRTAVGGRGIARLAATQVVGGLRPRDRDVAIPFVAPMSPLNGCIHGPRRFATQHYSLERLRALSKDAGVTINDVLLGVCSGALRRYLTEIDALPDRSLTATLPVSVRLEADESGGNAITFIHARLATDVEQPAPRLQRIAASTRHAKSVLGRLPRDAMNAYTMLLMAPYMTQLAVGLGGRTTPMHNVVVSNVPGPRQPRYIEGARVDQLYPLSVLFNGQALNVTVISYAGTMCIGFTGCRDSLPSMQRIAVFSGDSLEELERAVYAGGASD